MQKFFKWLASGWMLVLFFIGFFAGQKSIFRKNLGEAKVADAISKNLDYKILNQKTLGLMIF